MRKSILRPERDSIVLGGEFDYTHCPDCGTSVGVESLVAERHRCDGRHLDEHAEKLALAEVELFELELHEYLDSPQGRFAVFYAERMRRR